MITRSPYKYPKISLKQPQEGVLNLLLISRWILLSKHLVQEQAFKKQKLL